MSDRLSPCRRRRRCSPAAARSSRPTRPDASSTGTIVGEVGRPAQPRASCTPSWRRSTTSAATWAWRWRSCEPRRRRRELCAGVRHVRPGLHGAAREATAPSRTSSARCAWRPTMPTSTTTTAGSCARPGASRSRSSTSCRRSAIRSTGTPWRSYSAAGVCSLRSRTLKDADEFFQRALKIEPDEPASLLQLGQIRYRQGHIGEARKLVSRYNKLSDAERRVAVARAAHRAQAGRARRRAELRQPAAAAFPDSPEYQALQRGEFD